ncbi:MAG: hypothetical protein JW837_19175 [Sedimentisphaerales bacterium]|nr:hypothetical protein [Sedimentisphaerales bacterium]
MSATKTSKKSIIKRNIAKRPSAKNSLDMPEIIKKAESLGINPGEMTKTELIHSIQMAEGYQPCYGTSGGHCGYTECCFRTDCLSN